MSSIKVSELRPTMDYLLCVLEAHGLAEPSIKDYRSTFGAFERYVKERKVDMVSESICLDFIESKNGTRLANLYGDPSNASISRRMKALHFLMRYQEEGLHCHTGHAKRPPFSCPEGYRDEYEGYLKFLHEAGLSGSTILTRKDKAQALILFLQSRGVEATDAATQSDIDAFLLLYINNTIKYREAILCALRSFLGYLYEEGYTLTNLKEGLPHLRVPRNGGLTCAWKKEELVAILDAVDREDPAGKRDYAVLLLTIQSGLRAGDIRNLRMSDIDWNQKKIHLVMGKTRQPIDIPLLDPVGWSIIDYLKNGRPAVSNDHVFVRHRAPFGPLGGSGLGTALRRYIIKAGIETKGRGHHGLHSLRSTLAGNMLTSGASLPVISQTLGHQDIKTTEIYLKIDVEHLRMCALDPDAYRNPATKGGVCDA